MSKISNKKKRSNNTKFEKERDRYGDCVWERMGVKLGWRKFVFARHMYRNAKLS